MDDKGYTIEIVVHADKALGTSYATYVISRDGDVALSGTVAGGYKTHSEAEHEAEVASKRWVDERA